MKVNYERGEPLLGIVGRWHSLRSAGTERRHHDRLTEAFERGSTPPDGVGVTFIRARHVSALPEPSESRKPWLLWIDKPDRKRAEFMVGDELQTVVFRGDHWWSRSQSRGVHTNYGRTNYGHGLGPSEGMLKTDLLSCVARRGGLARSPGWPGRCPPSRCTSYDRDGRRTLPHDPRVAPLWAGRGRVPIRPGCRRGCLTPF